MSPNGIELQVAVALITYGVLLLYHAGGALSLKALQRQVKRTLHEALFAAGVAEGERRARARRDAGLPLLCAVGNPQEELGRHQNPCRNSLSHLL